MTDATNAFSFLSLGAIVQEFRVEGINIVLGFPSPELYEQHNKPFFGETIGRVANRISNAVVQDLNGRPVSLIANNGPNTLHGGALGFGKRQFDGPFEVQRRGRHALLFTRASPHGDQGFPGELELRVWYTGSSSLGRETVLDIEFEAELVGNAADETVVSVTNHSYFNLSGNATVLDTEVNLATNLHQVVEEHKIPTGVIEPFPNITANEPFTMGLHEPKMDHCFIMNSNPATIPLDSRSLPLTRQVSFFHPNTQIHLDVESTEPAFQLYTGDHICVPAVGGMPERGARAGIAVEPSRYINAVNVEEWKGMVLLRKGEFWGSRIRYRAWRD